MRVSFHRPSSSIHQGSIVTLLIHNATAWTGGHATTAFEVALLRRPQMSFQFSRKYRYLTCTCGWVGFVCTIGGWTYVRDFHV